MIAVGFFWTFAHVVLALIVLTIIAYAFPDNFLGQTAAIIK
jgi:hypothetical protein